MRSATRPPDLTPWQFAIFVLSVYVLAALFVDTAFNLSPEISGILLLTYLLSLLFSLKTHQHLFAGPEEQLPTTGEHHQPEWGRKTSLTVLLVATAGVAVMSEFLIHSVEHAARAFGMNQVFVGVIVVAIVGVKFEHGPDIRNGVGQQYR